MKWYYRRWTLEAKNSYSEWGEKYTDSGIEIKPVYTGSDVPKAPMPEGLEEVQLFFLIQEAYSPICTAANSGPCGGMPASTAEESNKRYHYLLSQGHKGLRWPSTCPQIGYDSDHALPKARWAKPCGHRQHRRRSCSMVFKLEDVSTSMTINANGFILVALYAALAKQQGALIWTKTALYKMITERICCKRNLHLSTQTFPCASSPISWMVQQWNAQVEHHLYIRLPHPWSRQYCYFGKLLSPLGNGKAYVKAALEKRIRH